MLLEAETKGRLKWVNRLGKRPRGPSKAPRGPSTVLRAKYARRPEDTARLIASAGLEGFPLEAHTRQAWVQEMEYASLPRHPEEKMTNGVNVEVEFTWGEV